jgi:hypothetical protein
LELAQNQTGGQRRRHCGRQALISKFVDSLTEPDRARPKIGHFFR